MLSRVVIHPHVLGDALRNGRPAGLEGGNECPSAFDEDQVGGPGAEINQERTPRGFRVVVTEGIVERHGSGIHDVRHHAPGLHRGIEVIKIWPGWPR